MSVYRDKVSSLDPPSCSAQLFGKLQKFRSSPTVDARSRFTAVNFGTADGCLPPPPHQCSRPLGLRWWVWSFLALGVKDMTVPLPALRSLGEAWTQLKKSLADEAEVHLKFSSKVSPPPHHPAAHIFYSWCTFWAIKQVCQTCWHCFTWTAVH